VHHPWIVHARDRTKRARTKRRVQSVEIGVVEGVEHFTAKLQASGLSRKLDLLEKKTSRRSMPEPVTRPRPELPAAIVPFGTCEKTLVLKN
jgi:hypothetical protein